jgi:putative ABC transport system permease protein
MRLMLRLIARVPPRWRKLSRDLWQERGRTMTMVIAIAASLVAIGSVLGAYAVLTREIAANYLGTRPANATLEMSDSVDSYLVTKVRAHPLVAEAEAREVIVARTQVGDEWRRTLVFVIDDFANLRLNRFRPEAGAWPPAEGEALLERSAVKMLGAGLGETIVLKPPHGAPTALRISGLVHDPGLAPAWQERSGYLYLTRATLARLGEPTALHELRIELRGQPRAPALIESQSKEIASWLATEGHPVHEIRIPPPAQHPHQKQMTTVLLMMLGFGAVALCLSAILVASSLGAMLARQVREIGIMKAVGATAWQVGRLYVVLVGVLGSIAIAVAMPLGRIGTWVFTRAISAMLNFEIADSSVPAWVFAIEVGAGILVPVALAVVPIWRASRRTVRQSLDDHGVSSERMRAAFAGVPKPLRNLFRRPGRVLLTMGLLAAAGAVFMTAINVQRGWRANVDKVYETRSYDVEAELQDGSAPDVVKAIAALPTVRTVEAWGFFPAAFGKPGEVDVARTYPDRGHGSLFVMAPPPSTGLIRFPVKAGRWLSDGDRASLVLNHAALAQMPHLRVGDDVLLSIDQGSRKPRITCRLVGVVEEIGSPGIAYVSGDALSAASGQPNDFRLLRIETSATTAAERTSAIRTIEQTLLAAGASVQSVVPLAELRTAIGDHVKILIDSLIAMAVVLAVVGALGLASSMGTNVVERTRELGIMKTLGATPRHIVYLLLGEGVAIALSSWFFAAGLSIPLSHFVDRLIGNLGFLAPLPLVLSGSAAGIWAILTVVVGCLATAVPARRAAMLVIRDALAHT